MKRKVVMEMPVITKFTNLTFTVSQRFREHHINTVALIYVSFNNDE